MGASVRVRRVAGGGRSGLGCGWFGADKNNRDTMWRMWAELPIFEQPGGIAPAPVSIHAGESPQKKFSMIKIYGMETCPDCTYVEEQVKGNDKYEVIDIGRNVRDLKAFLRLRDSNDAFALAKRVGAVGIPCFVLEDGTVTLTPEEAGLRSRPAVSGAACSIDGSGC